MKSIKRIRAWVNAYPRFAVLTSAVAMLVAFAGAVNYKTTTLYQSSTSWQAATGNDSNYATETGPWMLNGRSMYHALVGGGSDFQEDIFDYSVMAYGARGDGATLDSTAFQSCIDAANAAGGGTCYVPHTAAGYKVINLVLKDGVHLRGDDGAGGYNPSAINRTRLIAAATGIVIDTPVGGATMATIQGFSIVGLGAGTAVKGIRIQNGAWNQIKNVSIDQMSDEGIVVLAGQADTIEDVLLTNTVLNRTRGTFTGAVDVNGTDHYLHRVESNTSESSAVSSANLYVDAFVIRNANNFISDCVGEFSDIGFYVAGSFNRFSNVRADHNEGHGFYIVGGGNTFATNVALDNSQATSNTYSGFYVSGQTNMFAACFSGGAGTTQQYGFDDSGVQNSTIAGRSTYTSCSGVNNSTSLWHQNAFTNVDSGIEQPPATYHPVAGTTTPNIEGTSFVVMDNYSGATNVTNFIGGTNGQTLYVYGNANVTLVNSAALNTNIAANKTLRTGAIYTLKNVFGAWYEVTPDQSSIPYSLLPTADATYNLGSSVALGDSTNARFKNQDLSGNLKVGGTATLNGASIGGGSFSVAASFMNVSNAESILPTSSATSGSQLQSSNNLNLSYFYWNGSASTRVDNALQSVADSTTPTSHISVKFNGTAKLNMNSDGTFQMVGVAFASLPSPSNGSIIYCSDCTIANPCAGAGTGAIAKRLNGAWVCN